MSPRRGVAIAPEPFRYYVLACRDGEWVRLKWTRSRTLAIGTAARLGGYTVWARSLRQAKQKAAQGQFETAR